MRAAFIISAVLHLSLLVGLLGRFGTPDTFSTAAVAALPVELVTISEETDLTLGQVDAEEVVEEASTDTVETELPDTEQPGATGEEADTIATEEDARASADQSASPEPAADEAPAEAEAELQEPAEPEPAPQQEVAALPPEPEPEAATPEPEAATPAPEAAAPEPQEAEPAPVPQTVVPRRRPPPPPRRARRQQENEDAFDASRLSQLINRSDPSGGGQGTAQASLGSAAGRSAAALTLSEKDALRAQMQRCWNPPIGLANAADLVVVVQIRLAPDGAVVNIDRVGGSAAGALYDVAADSARRAVLQCQPYRLPVEKYDAWKDIQVTFDPRDLF